MRVNLTPTVKRTSDSIKVTADIRLATWTEQEERKVYDYMTAWLWAPPGQAKDTLFRAVANSFPGAQVENWSTWEPEEDEEF